MTPGERDQNILQYLWSKFGGRPSNRETLVRQDMMPCLYALLPEGQTPDEDAVLAYLQTMIQANCECDVPDGTRRRIVKASRPDWPIGEAGFQMVPTPKD